MRYKIFAISDAALTIDFGNEISVSLNNQVLSLADYVERNKFSGFIEAVPAYSSLTVFYDLIEVRRNFPRFSDAFSAVKNFVESALGNLEKIPVYKSRKIEMPVCYDAEFAPDLEFVANTANLTKTEVIRLHTSKEYRVFMIGFLPAFAYMGKVDEAIATPRRQSPRLKIEKGSVGIAGFQTGIYPLDSPGGWQIIGKTPRQMFLPEKTNISYLQAGDSVKFYSITKKEFFNFPNK